ncbi:MBL fold metallo-hydrolase [Streptococcus suis]|nr:MBL fold metallo-hydrolase [Streptococcus suis]
MKERRNMLFPFASEFGHSYFPNDNRLHKDVAYDYLPNKKIVKIEEFIENPLMVDGRRVRHLWSLTNPAILIHKLLRNELVIKSLEETENMIDLHILTMYSDEILISISKETFRPHSISWFTPQTNLGEVLFTTYFTGYMLFDKIYLPMGYTTKIDFRDIDYFKIYVDGYKINQGVEDVTLLSNYNMLESLSNKESEEFPIEKIAEGVWRIGGEGGSTIIEFEDHLTIFELYWNQKDANKIIHQANKLVPNKKVTELIISHAHFDHIGGFRAAVAHGLTIISNKENEELLRELANRKTPHFVDSITSDRENLRSFKFIGVDESLQLKDTMTQLDIYRVISNNHMSDAVFAYLPKYKIFMDSDVATAAYDWQFWPDSYLDNIEKYNLDVELVTTVHESTMTHDEVLRYITEGHNRLLEREKRYKEFDEHLPGLPIFRTRGDYE